MDKTKGVKSVVTSQPPKVSKDISNVLATLDANPRIACVRRKMCSVTQNITNLYLALKTLYVL